MLLSQQTAKTDNKRHMKAKWGRQHPSTNSHVYTTNIYSCTNFKCCNMATWFCPVPLQISVHLENVTFVYSRLSPTWLTSCLLRLWWINDKSFISPYMSIWTIMSQYCLACGLLILEFYRLFHWRSYFLFSRQTPTSSFCPSVLSWLFFCRSTALIVVKFLSIVYDAESSSSGWSRLDKSCFLHSCTAVAISRSGLIWKNISSPADCQVFRVSLHIFSVFSLSSCYSGCSRPQGVALCALLPPFFSSVSPLGTRIVVWCFQWFVFVCALHSFLFSWSKVGLLWVFCILTGDKL